MTPASQRHGSTTGAVQEANAAEITANPRSPARTAIRTRRNSRSAAPGPRPVGSQTQRLSRDITSHNPRLIAAGTLIRRRDREWHVVQPGPAAGQPRVGRRGPVTTVPPADADRPPAG